MSAGTNVDVVLVIDTSQSMQPCIDLLKAHLRELIKPMQGYAANVRFGLVAQSASKSGTQILYPTATIDGGWETLAGLYSRNTQYEFLTSDTDKVISRLDSLSASGDEDTLVALDIALDFPFGPNSSTKRVVAVFSDERLEAGVRGKSVIEDIPKIVEKIHARRIKLFCAIPFSDAAQRLSEANGSEIEDVSGGQGLANVDFKALLGQMGKSISVSSLQAGTDERYTKALFGQDAWVASTEAWIDTDNR